MCAAQPRPTRGAARRLVLVTRPEAEAQETAQLLHALGWEPLLSPALRIETREPRLGPLRRLQAVLATSGNALPSLPAALHGVPLLAVGDATAARASAAGFSQIASAGRDAAALLNLVVARCDPAGAPLLLAAGAGQGTELAAGLRRHGFRVLRRVVYAAHPVAALPAASLAALFFSPASGRAFAAAIRRAGLATALAEVTAAAISAATADAVSLLPWRDIRVASKPNQGELLACLK